MVERNMNKERISELINKKLKLSKQRLTPYFETLIFIALMAYIITHATWLVFLISIAIVGGLTETLMIKHRYRQYNQEIQKIIGNKDMELNKDLNKETQFLNRSILISIFQIILILVVVFL